MTGHEELFTQLKKRKGGTISFGDDSKGKIHGIGKRLKNMYVIFLEDLDVNSETKKIVSTSRPLELLHIDVFGPISTTSLGGKSYGFVIVDDYFRYTWVYFLAHKNDALQAFLSYCKKVENEKGLAIVSIRSDHGGEFENDEFEKLYNEKGLDHNFSAPRTP
ncbi:Integrase [Theobroma cacao]|nr:Integrase [Theobroma cacao]